MYPEAQNFYKGFLETFPNSKYAEEVDFQRAYSFYKQSPRIELEQVNTIKAMGQLQTFINQHPNSSRVQLATETIDLARAKLEQKDYRAAKLFFDIGHYRAASLAFAEITNNYPESTRGDEYFNMVVKANYRFAKLSALEKQLERYEAVVSSYEDFQDRYPESKLLKDAEQYNNLSLSQIKEIRNEQITSSVKL
jgi:outer membrane protein assembly factor BamD